MSEDLRSEAWQHLKKANSELQRGQYSAALANLKTAEELAHKANAPDVLSAVLGTIASVLQSRGMFEDALRMYTTVLNIQEDLAKVEPFFKTWVATTLNNLGNLLSKMGRPEEAKDKYERALEMRELLLETDTKSSVYQSQVAMTLNNLGALLSDMGRPEEAKDKYERALEMRELLLETDTKSSVYQSQVAMTLNNLGALLSDMGRPEEAKDKYERALEMYELLLETDTKSSVYQSQVATTLNNLGALLSKMGRPEEAKDKYERALEMRELLLETDTKSSVYQSQVATTLNNLGALLSDMGRPEEAKDKYERALEMYELLLETDTKSSVYQSDVAMTLNNLGALLSKMGRPEEAKDKYERALEMYELLLETDTKSSVYQSQVATTLNNLGALLSDMGRPEEAKDKYERALEMRELLLETDTKSSVYQSQVAMTLNNLGALLSDMGRPEEAKDKYERALEMYELLLETDTKSSVYQSQVATTLNNLGALLSDMGRPEEAKDKYERALEMYELLLETDTKSSVYQSDVAMTLNNLGALLSKMGRPEEAIQHYQNSLEIFTEPMQYLTIQAKARAIINIIQLVSGCAQEDTNIIHKSKYFKKVYDVYKQHDLFFSGYGLVHERRLVKETGLGAHIQYLMINAGNEKHAGKRIGEYEKCILEVEQIANVEDDEKLKELWSSVTYYLKGRLFVNKAMESKPPNSELMKKAIEQFKYAKENYKQAEVCYCIYTVLLELESIETFTDETKSQMNGLLKNAIKNLPEKMEGDVKSAFMEIEALLENRSVKTGPEMFELLNCCITKIDYYALRDHFNYISQKIATYFKEPFSPNVSYSNWKLIVTFDEPEKVQGKLTIKAGDRIIFDEPLGKRNQISLKHRSEIKNESITFITKNSKNVTREITYSEKIDSDDGHIDVYFLEHDCKRPSTDGHFNIAIVQLKYHLRKTGHALIIEHNEAYFRKVMAVLDAVKGKADLVVFPEFSIPFSFLSAMKQYSDDNGIAIVAGSHYVTDDNLDKYGELFYHKFDENNDLLKNISPVIIPSSEKILHTEKMLGAKDERKFLSEKGMTHGTLNRIFKLNNNVTFGVIICFDFLKHELRARNTNACNIILVPQTNEKPKEFHEIAQNEINFPDRAGNKAYIMASGIFTYDDGINDYNDKNIMGGYSGVTLTLDKDLYKKLEKSDKSGKPVIESVNEQAIMLASLNMDFFAARDTGMAQVPLCTQLIHIFEESEMLKSEKNEDKVDVPAFFELLEKIKSCTDRSELKELLAGNDSLISRYSPLMHKSTSGDLTNLKLGNIKKKCANIVIK